MPSLKHFSFTGICLIMIMACHKEQQDPPTDNQPDEVKDSIVINLAGKEYQWSTPADSLIFTRSDMSTYIAMIQKNTTGQGIGLKLNDTIPHQGHTAVTIYIYENAYRYYGDNVSYNVTKYGRNNEYIEVDFSGQVRTDSAQTGDFRSVSGNMLIRRRN